MEQTNQNTPWVGEPNIKRWYEYSSGLKCGVVRHAGGHLDGYVRIPRKSRLYRMLKKHKSTFPVINELSNLEVHGGITYIGSDPFGFSDGGLWIGFDTNHHFDQCFSSYDFNDPGKAVCRYPEKYKNMNYMFRHTAELAKQVMKILKKEKKYFKKGLTTCGQSSMKHVPCSSKTFVERMFANVDLRKLEICSSN